MLKTCHLKISGRVQGVAYRFNMAREARRRGVAGWVRNRSDGTVEAIVHGPTEAVDGLIEWTHRGPPNARVNDVEVTPAEGSYSGFEQRETE